jgi:hypothetical protein
MLAHEFESHIKPDGTLAVPAEIAAQIPQGESIRVIVLVETAEEEDAAWRRLTTEQFFKGYAEEDAVYDDLSAG